MNDTMESVPELRHRQLINDPTEQLPGFNLPRKIWSKLNTFRTGRSRSGDMHNISTCSAINDHDIFF